MNRENESSLFPQVPPSAKMLHENHFTTGEDTLFERGKEILSGRPSAMSDHVERNRYVFPEKDEAEGTPLYAQKMEYDGLKEIEVINEGVLSGAVFKINDIEYLLIPAKEKDFDGEDRIFDLKNKKFIKDEAMIEQMKNKNGKNINIGESREKRAKDLAKEDKNLEQVYSWNMEYRNGDIDFEPLKINGIDFYQVGANASHAFYIGTKDGKKYRLVFDPIKDDKKLLKEKKVKNWEGYYYGN